MNPIGRDGGEGFDGPWALGGAGVSNAAAYHVLSKSLRYPGLRIHGGACQIPSSRDVSGMVRRLGSAIRPRVGDVRYFSFLIRPEGRFDEGIGNGFFGVTLMSNAVDLFVGRPGGNRTDRYVLEDRGGAHQVASNLQPKIGETALLVVKVEYRAGRDRVTLYPDPIAGPVEPRHGTVKEDSDIGETQFLALYSGGAYSIDELRVGKTFREVVPTHLARPSHH